jgi:hypothetical protein
MAATVCAEPASKLQEEKVIYLTVSNSISFVMIPDVISFLLKSTLVKVTSYGILPLKFSTYMPPL